MKLDTFLKVVSLVLTLVVLLQGATLYVLGDIGALKIRLTRIETFLQVRLGMVPLAAEDSGSPIVPAAATGPGKRIETPAR